MLNWVEIDASALRGNLAEFRRRLQPGTRLAPVVKSNAYGHGMLEVSRIAIDAGATWLAVNNLDEGVRLRDAAIDVPVLVLGYVALGDLEQAVARDLKPVLYNLESLERVAAAAESLERDVGVHLKVETGTHRQGIAEPDLAAFVERIAASPRLRLEGLTTHFANIEDTTDHGYAELQMATFARVQEAVGRLLGAPVPIRHTACSAAALLFGRTHMDLARIGISTYGLWPSRETYVACLERGKPTLDLRPVLTWKTRVAQLKRVPEGAFVGYGCTYRTTRPSHIAVLPVGYHEGYDRGLSNVGHVLVRGRRAPVRGRVCMNMCMVDVTDVPGAALEDEVVLLGRQGDEAITAEQVAGWCGTIAYEIVARIHPALPRVVIAGP